MTHDLVGGQQLAAWILFQRCLLNTDADTTAQDLNFCICIESGTVACTSRLALHDGMIKTSSLRLDSYRDAAVWDDHQRLPRLQRKIRGLTAE